MSVLSSHDHSSDVLNVHSHGVVNKYGSLLSGAFPIPMGALVYSDQLSV